MKIANIEILRDNWVYFLKDLYLMQGSISKKFITERYCKCDGLDVKLVLKMEGNFEFKEDNNCLVAFQIILSTDCISLRRSNYFWSDKESFLVSRIIDPLVHIESQFENIVDEIIQKMNTFKICSQCRILYQEDREEEPQESICIHCRFDSIFFPKDICCAICKDMIYRDEQSFTLTCAHTYHSACVLLHFIKTAKRECPLCRESDSHQI
jgi:hypothetical protein